MEAVGHDRLKVFYHRLKGAMVAILRKVSVKMMITYIKSLTADLALSILSNVGCEYQIMVGIGCVEMSRVLWYCKVVMVVWEMM